MSRAEQRRISSALATGRSMSAGKHGAQSAGAMAEGKFKPSPDCFHRPGLNLLRFGVAALGVDFQHSASLQRNNGLGDTDCFVSENFQHGTINKNPQFQLPFTL